MAALSNGANAVDKYAEVFDEGHDVHRDGVHQRIRANSTIMQLKKILGIHPHNLWLPGCHGNQLLIRDYTCCSCQ